MSKQTKAELQVENERLREEVARLETQGIIWFQEIRAIVGDCGGKLMADEVVELVRELKRRSEWIEADTRRPVNHRSVIMYNRCVESVCAGVYSNGFTDCTGEEYDDGDITYWMELPPAPAKDKKRN